MQDLEKIVELTSAKETHYGGFVGHCPIHNDKKPSLSITDRGDMLLVHCHAGCRQEDVIGYFKDNNAWHPLTEEEREACWFIEDDEIDREEQDARIDEMLNKSVIVSCITEDEDEYPSNPLVQEFWDCCNVSGILSRLFSLKTRNYPEIFF